MSETPKDPIVMAADAGKAFCIRRLKRAISSAKRLRAMPLNAEECVTILENSTWDDEPLPVHPAAQGPEEPAARLEVWRRFELALHKKVGNTFALAQVKRLDAFFDWLASPALPAEAPLETRLCSFCPDPVGPAYGSDDLKHTICHQCIEKAARFFRASASAVSLTAQEWDAPLTKEQIHALAQDIGFAIDVTEPKEVLIARFEDAIRFALQSAAKLRTLRPPTEP